MTTNAEQAGTSGKLEGNDPFRLRRFSLRRYSVRHMLMIVTLWATLASLTGYALATGQWLIAAMAAPATGLVATIIFLLARVAVKRITVEQWIRRLGMGDFDYTIAPWGNDELSKCCVALETLRLKAIEAMQLDRVRELSEELQGKNDQLEETLSTLRTAQDQMVSQQKLAELGELSAGVAHEIRNPLQFIRNFAEEAEQIVAERENTDDAAVAEIQPTLHENIAKVIEYTERAERVVADMLALHPSQARDFRECDVNAVVRQQTAVAEKAATTPRQSKAPEVSLTLDKQAGTITAIPEDIARVVRNLVSNACQSVDERRQHEGEEYRGKVSVSTQRSGENVTIKVHDNGTGIEEAIRGKIFSPFFTTRRSARHTGLGLSIVHDAAREHGGSIEVESETGEWASISVTIPTRATPASASAKAPNGPADSSEQPEAQIEDARRAGPRRPSLCRRPHGSESSRW